MNLQPAPIQEILDDFLYEKQVQLFVKREDLLHPLIKGNKWYKLKYNLAEAKNQGVNKLLTFGGAFSNHIYATASAGKLFDFETIGIIRGEETLPLNPVLAHARDCGMQLHYLDRTAYRQKNEELIIQKFKEQFGAFYLIPEGGTNEFAVKGTAEILQDIENEYYTYVCCAYGTGGTLAGLAVAHKAKVLGFAVLKGNFLENDVKTLLENTILKNKIENLTSIPTNWQINNAYHFGGYAKITAELLDFVHTFNQKYQIPIDTIYTGKLFYGIFDLIKKDYFPPHTRLLAIHSGGVYS